MLFYPFILMRANGWNVPEPWSSMFHIWAESFMPSCATRSSYWSNHISMICLIVPMALARDKFVAPYFTFNSECLLRNKLNHFGPAISLSSENPCIWFSSAYSYAISLISEGMKGNLRRLYSEIRSTRSSKIAIDLCATDF